MRSFSSFVLATSLVAGLLPALPAAAAVDGWAGRLPTTGDVTVATGTTATLDTDLDLRVLRIDGTVRCDAATDVTLHAEAIHVRPGGTFECGTDTDRFGGRLEVVLDGPAAANHVGAGARSLLVEDGLLSLHGEDRGVGHRSLTASAPAGATTLQVDDASGWRVGDRVVVTSTDYIAEHDERVTITGVSGSTLTVTPALQHRHHCATETHGGRSIRQCAAVGLLSRNVVVRGPDSAPSSRVGGHVIAVRDGVLRVAGTELRNMGQEQRLGRYPIHWHLVDDGTGSYLRDSSVVDGFNRFLSIHGTDNVEISGTVGAGTIGHGFYLEDGSESANTFFCNLGTGIVRPEAADAMTPSDVDASVFWISNPDNTLVENVAVGGFAGYSLSFADRPVGLSSGAADRPRTTPLREFRDNVASGSHFAGLFVDHGENPDRTVDVTWYSPRTDPTDESSAPVTPVIDGFTAFKSRHYGIWIRTFSGVDIRGAAIADTLRSIYLANVQTKGYDTWGVVSDSLLVGESGNVGTGYDWETLGPGGRPAPKHWERGATISGMQVYDGPFELRDTTLANFVSRSGRRAGGFGTQSPNPFSVDARNRSRGLTFVNANRVAFATAGPDGDDGTVLHDVDGTLTGTPGASVTTRGTLLDDATCAHRADWQASVCTGLENAGIYVMRRDGGDADVRVTRLRDGRVATFTGSGTSKPALLLDEPHHLSFTAGDDAVGKLQVMISDRSSSGSVSVSLPQPAGAPEISFWSGTRTPTMAPSLAALAGLDQGWWYDAAARRVHLRIGGSGVTLHGATSGGSTHSSSSGGGSGGSTSGGSTSGRSTSGGSTSGGSTSGGATGGRAPTLPTFGDVPGSNAHRTDIRLLAAAGITTGCGSRTKFCPDRAVTRAQMASFLVRALEARPRSWSRFRDVPSSNVHGRDIATLAALGITRGCGSGRFCPDKAVTRAQMATFLVRALDLPAAAPGAFRDVPSSHVHARDIAALARAGITSGCGRGRFCPDKPVTRAQMASFLVRAFEL